MLWWLIVTEIYLKSYKFYNYLKINSVNLYLNNLKFLVIILVENSKNTLKLSPKEKKHQDLLVVCVGKQTKTKSWRL